MFALAPGIAEALAGVHSAGLVHRALRPSTVLVAAEGAHLIGFGSAAPPGTAGTIGGTLPGMPEFLAPEQLTGGEVTPACDVFSFGGVLYFAATGRAPFGEGDQLLTIRRRTAPDSMV